MRRFWSFGGNLSAACERQGRFSPGMGPAEIREYCHVDGETQGLLRAAMKQLHMSARAYHRVLKLARTVADLAGSARIETVHLAEAIQYRPRQTL